MQADCFVAGACWEKARGQGVVESWMAGVHDCCERAGLAEEDGWLGDFVSVMVRMGLYRVCVWGWHVRIGWWGWACR